MTKSNKRPSLLKIFRHKQKVDALWQKHYEMKREQAELLRSHGRISNQLITIDGKMHRISIDIPHGAWGEPRLEIEYIGESSEIKKLVTNDLA